MLRTTCLLIAATCSLMAVDLAGDARISIVRVGGRALLAVHAPETRSDPQTDAQLQQRVWLHFEDTTVAEACDQLARATGTNIVVGAGLQVDSPEITLRADDMTAARVLKWIAELGDVHLTPMHGGILVTREEPKRPKRLKLYDVGSLTMSVPDFPGPTMGVNPTEDGFEIQDHLIMGHEEESEDRLDRLVELLEGHLERDKN